APGVVAAVAELDVEVRAGEGDAAGVVAGAVHVLLRQHLRGEVRGLRAEDGERLSRLRLGRVDEQRVARGSPSRRAARRLRLALQLGRLDRAVVGELHAARPAL